MLLPALSECAAVRSVVNLVRFSRTVRRWSVTSDKLVGTQSWDLLRGEEVGRGGVEKGGAAKAGVGVGGGWGGGLNLFLSDGLAKHSPPNHKHKSNS